MCYHPHSSDTSISEEQANRDIDYGDNQPESSGNDALTALATRQAQPVIVSRVGQSHDGTVLNSTKEMFNAMKDASALGLNPNTEEAGRLNKLFQFHEGLGLTRDEAEAIASGALFLKGQSLQVADTLQNSGIGILHTLSRGRLAALSAASMAYGFESSVWPKATNGVVNADPRKNCLVAAEEATGFKLGQEVFTKNGRIGIGTVSGFARVGLPGQISKRMLVVRGNYQSDQLRDPENTSNVKVEKTISTAAGQVLEQQQPVSSGC